MATQLLLNSSKPSLENPEELKHRRLRALYISGFINGKAMNKMIVDRSAAINVMLMATFKKLGKGSKNMIKTKIILKYFEGNKSKAKEVLNVELNIGSKMIPATFFIIGWKGVLQLVASEGLGSCQLLHLIHNASGCNISPLNKDG
jgi:hypothetical protein